MAEWNARNEASMQPSNDDEPQKNNAAMNLFEKYSCLNQSIDETREILKQVRWKIEQTNESIESTRQERDSMQRDTSTAHAEANDFHRQVDEAYEKLSKIQTEHSRILMEKQRAERQLEGVKSFVEENRRQFLDQSREFRASCKRVRLRANDLGLEYAPSRAFATVMMDPLIPEEWQKVGNAVSPCSVMPCAFQEDESGVHRPALMPGNEQLLVLDGSTNDSGVDPAKWVPDPCDEEMKEALELFKKERELHEEVKYSLEQLKAKSASLNERAANRRHRTEKLQSQLDRISGENASLEDQIVELEQVTINTKEMAESYKKNVRSKRNEMAQRRFEEGLTSPSYDPVNIGVAPGVFQDLSRPAGRVPANISTQNPYAKTTQLARRASSNFNHGGTMEKSFNVVPTTTSAAQARQQPQSRSLGHAEKQHPHRAGRIRLDRQFRTNLEITAGDEILDEVGSSITQRVSQPKAARINASSLQESISLLEDDSDDDALLSKLF